MIPCADPRASYLAHRKSIDEAVARVLGSGTYILGEEVRAFERAFATYTGVAHAVGVANGTDALHLALRAYGVGPGDEVITASHTAVATIHAVLMTGARPVLVDIADDMTLLPEAVGAAVTSRTKAIVPVHLYGQPARMDQLLELANERELRLIEDASQAHGAKLGTRRVGSLGDAGCFSFYPTKNLGAFGDGGMVVTDDAEVAERVRALREYGWDAQRMSLRIGVNSRLDELQAAILRVKLEHLDADNESRRRHAQRYAEGLTDSGLTLPVERSGTTHAFHLYVVRTAQRQALREYLASQGIAPGVHYPVPAHLHPGLAPAVSIPAPLPKTEQAAQEVLSLPLYPELEREKVEDVIAAVRRFGSG